jgi:hypothetical protein
MEPTSGSIDQLVGLRPVTPTSGPWWTRAVWPRAAPGLVLSAGACLMLYGSTQNGRTGPGPTAFTAGAVVVGTVAALIVVAAIHRTVRDNAAARSTGQFFQLRCTSCNIQLPGQYRAQDSEGFAKAVRKHDDDAHAPHDPAILQILAVRIALIRAGTVDAPTLVRRYELTASDRTVPSPDDPARVRALLLT